MYKFTYYVRNGIRNFDGCKKRYGINLVKNLCFLTTYFYIATAVSSGKFCSCNVTSGKNVDVYIMILPHNNDWMYQFSKSYSV